MFDRKYQQLIQTLTNGRFIFDFKIQIDISYSRLIEIIQIKKTQQRFNDYLYGIFKKKLNISKLRSIKM